MYSQGPKTLETLSGYKTSNNKIEQGVYELWHIETNRVYIGSTGNLHNRMMVHFGHLRRNTHCNRNLQDVFILSPEFKLIFHPDPTGTKKDLIMKEQGLIDKYFLQGNILNIAKDAEVPARGIPMTEGQRWLLLKINTGRVKSLEEREKLRQGRLGKIQSPEAREKIRQSKLGKKLPDWHVQLLKEANTGRKVSEETKEYQRNNPCQRRPVSIDGVIYSSIRGAARSLGLTVEIVRNRLFSKTNGDPNWFVLTETPIFIKSSTV